MTSKLLALAALAALANVRIQEGEVMPLRRESLIEGPKFGYDPVRTAQYKSDKPKVRSSSFKRNKRKSK